MEAAEAARLRWRCRRGMKELDELLLHYLLHVYPDAPDAQRVAFAHLLEWPDPDLYALVAGRLAVDDPEIGVLAERIRRIAGT